MSGGGKGGKSVVVGYQYFWGLHVVLAHEINAVLGLRFGEKYGWEGVKTGRWTADGPDPSIGDSSIVLDAPTLFSNSEGGVSGVVNILNGGPYQPRHPYLLAKVSPLMSAARGVASLVFRQTYWGNNPYMRPLGVRAVRTRPDSLFAPADARWDEIGESAVPYEGMAETAADFDMNPAHMIYECLTNADWGRGLDPGGLDLPSFAAAAATLFAERLGLSLLWDAQSSVEDFIQSVLEHIDATLYEIPSSGRIGLKLLRGDYDPAGLALLGPDEIIRVEQYYRPGWGEITNEVKVLWRDDLNRERTVYARDQAAVNMQGSVVSETLDFPGLRHAELAQRVADRELAQRTGSLCQATLVATRAARGLKPGDVFAWRWPEYGIERMVLRVLAVSHGALTDGTVRLTCAQDVFAEPVISTVAPPRPVPWTSPVGAPAPASAARLLEAPYWHVIKHLTGEYQFLLNEFGPDSAALLVLAPAPQADSAGYQAVFDAGQGYDPDEGLGGAWTPGGVLALAVGPAETEILLADLTDFEAAKPGQLLFLENEILLVRSVNNGALGVARGVLDTLPAPHPAGARALLDAAPLLPREEYASGETVKARVLTRTPGATLALAEAPELSVTLAGRFARPYPPGRLRVNGQAWPAAIPGTAGLSLTWAHRNRAQQTAYVVTQDEDGVTPEQGTTSTLRIYGETGTLLRTVQGLETEGWDYAPAEERADSGLALPDPETRTYDQVVAAAGPTAYWRMGEAAGPTLADSSGHGHDAACFNNPVFGEAGAVPGNTAVRFDGLNDYAQVPHQAALNPGTGEYAIECWLKFTGTAYGMVFGKFYDPSPYQGPTVFSNYSSAGRIQMRDQSGGGYELTSAAAGLNDGAYRHYVFQRRQVSANVWKLEMFINGVLNTSLTLPSVLDHAPANPICIMGRPALQWVAGTLDELAYYVGRALTPEEAAAHYAAREPSASSYRLNGRLRFELESVRDGLASLQRHDRVIPRAGYGFQYGNFYGGI
jgi:hypothetical protein